MNRLYCIRSVFFIVKYIGTIIYSAQLKSDIFVKKAN